MSCQQVELPKEKESGARPVGPEFTALVEVFRTDTDGKDKIETRTALQDYSVVWNAGDPIAIFQGVSVADKYQMKEDGAGKTSGTFEIVEKNESANQATQANLQTNIALYPYESDLICTPVTAENGATTAYQISGVTIPSIQTYAENSFADESFLMAALTNDLEDHTLNFKNVCGALRLQLKGTAIVKSIELRGNDNELLSGNATVEVHCDGTIPAITMSSEAFTSVTINCGDGVQLNETEVTTFNFTIPPTIFAKGFTIIIIDSKGSKTKVETSKLNQVKRSHILTMPEIVVESMSMYKPYIELGALSTLGVWAKNFYGKQYYRTPRYMKVTDTKVEVNVIDNCHVRMCQYDKDFKFLQIIDFTPVEAKVAKEYNLNASCQYIRLVFRKDASVPAFDLPEVYVKNVEEQEYFEPRPADEGYQKILAHVNVGGEILADYGVVCLPETYSNVGEQTRLIIFCHGAAVNYPTTVSRFVDSDINPEYWLKEGYAIMDIEGNPYDNSNEHFYVPAAKKSYEAAYNWVINTYNIRTDGVFLGGRSMGGGMCFDILQSTIPVIAACPVVPACNTLWHWNYCNADRKKFCSEKVGFTGTPPAWTSNKKMTDEEYLYLYENFDKMMECAPIWRGIVDLPSKDELFSVGKVSANVAYEEAEHEFYSKLSFRVKAPVKIFTCYEDKTVPYQRNAQLVYNMMKNAGMECELSLVHTDASNAHRYEQQDSKANINVTTRYGETISAPWVYVDMLKFWRKYEKKNE